MRPQQGNVRTQARTMFLAMDQFTDLRLLEAPTPIMADVEQCEVETGMPVMLETNRVMTVLIEAATPWCFFSFTISMATDLMMRLPPRNVPREIASEHAIMSQNGKPAESADSMPNDRAMPRMAIDMNF